MNQLPAHLQARQKRDLVGAAIGGLNTGSPPHISIADNRFTLVDDAGNQKPMQTLHLDVCVIDANASVSKIFFDPRIPFEPGGDNSNPPLCWSDNGVGASAQASQPQNTSCQLCPQNAWGSATSKATGKPVKACNDVKKVAVVVAGIDMVFLLRIPPASLKNWGKYCQTLAGHGVDLPDAVTRLEFESQGVLKFTPMGYVDEAVAAFSDKVMVAKGTDLLIGRNDRPWGGQGDVAKVAYAAQQQNMPPPQASLPAQQNTVAPPPQPFGGGQAPVAPFGAAIAETRGPAPFQPAPFAKTKSPSDPFGQPGTSSPTAATPEAKTRKPRTPRAEPAAAPDDGIPPFLRRDPPAAAAPAPNPTQFGMVQNPPAPDAGVQAALDAAFRLPT
jgi:hypothetical protein